ncbi:MAG TPA: VOC family protein [Verrucomicrobiae bacterium]|jgi:catechol 2,3-dioxygenase-like lactoylglutathione lyase family enzyme|nr:VOC family protein [Verrucomicrobiae bacterium]
MGKIRHLAIRTEDPEKLAAFYKDVFGLQEIHRGSHPGHAAGKTVHLTDGYFELALLDNSAQQSRNGLYHFGIQIDDIDDTLKRVDTAQPNKPVRKRPAGTPFAEMRVSDPDGNFIDLSVHGFLEYQPLKKV